MFICKLISCDSYSCDSYRGELEVVEAVVVEDEPATFPAPVATACNTHGTGAWHVASTGRHGTLQGQQYSKYIQYLVTFWAVTLMWFFVVLTNQIP